MDITDEMANREARRAETLRLLNHQSACFEALDDISVIQRELDRYVNEGTLLWAYLHAYLLGKICGIRQERARRARKAAHNVR